MGLAPQLDLRGWLVRLFGVACLVAAVPDPAAAREIIAAAYSSPTSAYPHDVLGDDQEWEMLDVTVRSERGTEGGLFHGYVNLTYQIAARPESVFEDIAPRLWDVTGDGAPEVVVVESHQSQGARLLVVGLLEDGSLEYLAATPHIGQRFRWLAPVGAADFDGDGFVEIAFVDRPHLAKTLRVWRYTGDAFSEIATLKGVTNHRIGEDFITGGVRDCGAGPEMIVVDATWQHILAARLNGTDFDVEPVTAFEGPASVDRALACD